MAEYSTSPKVSVAPMMDWTDRHCRFLMRLLSPNAQLYTEMVTAAAIEWADESFQITITPSVNYCVQKQGVCWYTSDNMMLGKGESWRDITITEDYLDMHAAIVTQRLQQAGVRLAELLNEAFQR